jgi:hypothetical protein
VISLDIGNVIYVLQQAVVLWAMMQTGKTAHMAALVDHVVIVLITMIADSAVFILLKVFVMDVIVYRINTFI